MNEEQRNWLSLFNSAYFPLFVVFPVGVIAAFNLQSGMDTELGYVTFIFVILFLLFLGIMGITEKEERLKKLGYLYLGSGCLFIGAWLLLI